MPTTTISVSSFQTACAECADAVADEDWSTAVKWYARAEAINAGLELSVGTRGTSMSRRETLQGLREAISAAKAAVAAADDVERRPMYGRTSQW